MKRRRNGALLAALMLVSQFANAKDFTGIYNGSFDGSLTEMSCNLDFQGMDGGPFVITENEFLGVEGACELSKPTDIRDMDARLYDAKCFVEGDESTSRLLLIRNSSGVYMHYNGQMRNLKICQ